MPDRRQGDRRESSNGIASKKIEISLGTFICIVLFVLTVIILTVTSVVVAKIYYNKGYEKGIEDVQTGQVSFGSVEYEYDENLLVSSEYQNIQ